MLTLSQHAAQVSLTTALLADGTLLARWGLLCLDGGAYADASVIVCEKEAYRSLSGPIVGKRWKVLAKSCAPRLHRQGRSAASAARRLASLANARSMRSRVVYASIRSNSASATFSAPARCHGRARRRWIRTSRMVSPRSLPASAVQDLERRGWARHRRWHEAWRRLLTSQPGCGEARARRLCSRSLRHRRSRPRP